MSNPWSISNSIGLSGVKKFRVGTSDFNCNWGSLTLAVDTVGFLALLPASSVSFHFRLLYSQNSSMDGGAVIIVLIVSPFAELSLAAILSEAGGDSSWCPPCSGWLETISDFASTRRKSSMRTSATGCCCVLFYVSTSEIQSDWAELPKFCGGSISHDTSYLYGYYKY